MKIRLGYVSNESTEIVELYTAQDIFDLSKRLGKNLIINQYHSKEDDEASIDGNITVYDGWIE